MRTAIFPLTIFFVAVMAVAALGCNTFDPDLGATPFKCGVVEPRCPDDYACVETSPSVELCVSKSQNPDEIPDGGRDPGEFSCNDDSEIELNNTTGAATPTGVDDQPSQTFVGLAICPANDADYFSFRVAGDQKTVTVSIETGIGDGVLSLEMVNNVGASLGMGTPDPLDPDKISLNLTNVPPNQYFAKVVGDGAGQNNYDITVSAQ